MTYQYVLGIDLSKWQDQQVNWNLAIEKGVRFAWIKGADGITKDSKFDLHWQTSAGFVYRGVYLYYRDQQDPIEQADKLFDYCQAHGDLGELPPALDIEETNNPTLTASKIKTCLERLEVKFGRKPIIYTSAVIWNKHIGNVVWADEYDLWAAHYPYSVWFPEYVDYCRNLDPNIYPARPLPWKNAGLKAQAWQICGFAPAIEYGVSTNPLAKVDLNFFPGTEQDLEDYAEWIITPPPPPDPIIEDEIMYLTDVVYLPPGVTYRNVRSKPHSSGVNVGMDVGDVTLADKNMPVYAIVTNAEGDWYHLKKGELVGWVLAKAGGVTYLSLEELPMPYVTHEEMEAAISEALENLPGLTQPPFTHKIKTTEPNGVKLDAYPAGGEAVMLLNATPVRLLKSKLWKNQKLYAALVGDVWVSGWLEPSEVEPL